MLLRLHSEARALLEQAVSLAARRGERLYLVGGTVRDLLLGRTGVDLDVVLQGDAPGLAELLARQTGGSIRTHHQFGTASVINGALTLDLATARTETFPRPGALPVVKPGTVLEDLRRRDFTINAIALSLGPEQPGEVLDPWGGIEDLRRATVRVLHDGSFVDDPTRMLRAVRFEQRFGFQLDQATESLVKRDARMLNAISRERVRHEIERTLAEQRPEVVMARSDELGLLRAIHPSLHWNDRATENFRRARELGDGTPEVYAGLLALSVNTVDSSSLAKRLDFPKSWAAITAHAPRLASMEAELSRPALRASELDAALRGSPLEAVRACRAAAGTAIMVERLGHYLDELEAVRPLLNGHDLLGLGVPPGPMVGEGLEALRRARLDGHVASRGDEEGLIRKWLHGMPEEQRG